MPDRRDPKLPLKGQLLAADPRLRVRRDYDWRRRESDRHANRQIASHHHPDLDCVDIDPYWLTDHRMFVI